MRKFQLILNHFMKLEIYGVVNEENDIKEGDKRLKIND